MCQCPLLGARCLFHSGGTNLWYLDGTPISRTSLWHFDPNGTSTELFHPLRHLYPVTFRHPFAMSSDFMSTPVSGLLCCDISFTFLWSTLGFNCPWSPGGARCDISSHCDISSCCNSASIFQQSYDILIHWYISSYCEFWMPWRYVHTSICLRDNLTCTVRPSNISSQATINYCDIRWPKMDVLSVHSKMWMFCCMPTLRPLQQYILQTICPSHNSPILDFT